MVCSVWVRNGVYLSIEAVVVVTMLSPFDEVGDTDHGAGDAPNRRTNDGRHAERSDPPASGNEMPIWRGGSEGSTIVRCARSEATFVEWSDVRGVVQFG